MGFSTSTDSLPIVFIHSGGDSYLACSLTQARQSNPNADIFLIGDRFNRGFLGIQHLQWRDYTKGASEFAKIYQHRNTNPHGYELFCMQRWLILNEMMQRRNLSRCLYIDSDVLLYEKTEKVVEAVGDVDWTSSGTSFSPHFTCFKRREVLEQFCDFLFEVYTEPKLFAQVETIYTSLQAQKREGGVCDMTVFSHFAQRGNFRWRDISAPANIVPCDISMALDEDGYEMSNGVKKIEWRDGLPCARHGKTGQQVTFQALHFQGPSKGKIFRHVRFSSPGEKVNYFWNRLIAKKGKYLKKMS